MDDSIIVRLNKRIHDNGKDGGLTFYCNVIGN